MSRAGMVELAQPLPPSDLVNADLAPTRLDQRTWNLWHIAALWVGMSVCIPTYMLAASMIDAGLSWRQSLIRGTGATGAPVPVRWRLVFREHRLVRGVLGAHENAERGRGSAELRCELHWAVPRSALQLPL
jgi:hypothetical protein